MKAFDAISAILTSALKVNEEKRNFDRIPLCAKVRIVVEDRIIAGELVNISLGGALVIPDRPIPPGSSVIVTIFDTPTSRIISDLRAKVVWVAGQGTALQFIGSARSGVPPGSKALPRGGEGSE